MINSIEKNKKCVLCHYAPVVFFLILDFVGCMYGLIVNPIWFLVQIILCLIYIRKSRTFVDFFSIDERKNIIIKPSGALALLTLSISCRFLIAKLFNPTVPVIYWLLC